MSMEIKVHDLGLVTTVSRRYIEEATEDWHAIMGPETAEEWCEREFRKLVEPWPAPPAPHIGRFFRRPRISSTS